MFFIASITSYVSSSIYGINDFEVCFLSQSHPSGALNFLITSIKFDNNFELLQSKLYELEEALIPEGLHVIGSPPSDNARDSYLSVIPGIEDHKDREYFDHLLTADTEIKGLINALKGK